MKILLFGRGVIGALYGSALEKAGHTVEFYVRAGRAAHYGTALSKRVYDTRTKARGLLVEENSLLTLREDIPTNHNYDLIIVSVQHQQFGEAVKALTGKVANATILIFNNFWTEPQLAVLPLPAEQLAWGFPGAGGAFDEDNTLHGALLKPVQFGTFGTDPTARELAVRQVFRAAGFTITEHRDFRAWLWMHFAVNAGLHLQSLRANSVRAVFDSPAQARESVRNVQELLPLLKARGIDIDTDASDLALYKLPPWVGALALTMAARFFPPLQALIAHNAVREEFRSFCRDVLLEAHKLGVSLPRFEASAALFEREYSSETNNR